MIPIRPEHPAAAQGPAGTLDPTFDSDGVAINELESEIEAFGMESALLPDGKVLVLAEELVWRFDPDGTLDPTFDLDGVLEPASVDSMFATQLALRPGGGFVLAGSSVSGCGEGDDGVARFDAEGVLDTSWGTVPVGDGPGGVACVNDDQYELTRDMAVQADDRVVVVGARRVSADILQPMIVRITATDGTVDASRTLLDSEATGDVFHEVAIQSSGRIIAAGVNFDTGPGGGNDNILLAGFTQDPLELDPNFGIGGIPDSAGAGTGDARLALGTGLFADQIVVALEDNLSEPRRALIRWWDVDGQWINEDQEVTTFPDTVDFVSVTGVEPSPAGFMTIGSVAFDVGEPPENTTPDQMFAIAHLRGFSELEPDLFVSPVPDNGLETGGAVMMPGGQVLVPGNTGTMLNTLGPFAGPLFLAQLVETTDGGALTGAALDTSFGGDGFVVVNGLTEDTGNAVAVQSDGKPVVGGTNGRGGFVLRHLADGSLDAGFGSGGFTFTSFDVLGVAIAPDGNIVAVGRGFQEGPDFGVVQRFLPNGTPDPAWNGGQSVPVPLLGTAAFLDVAVQSDGKVVAVGEGALGAIYVARLLTDGDLDDSFGGGDGLATIGAGSGVQRSGIAIQPDGKIVVSGRLQGDLVLARLDAGGVRDPTFGTDGLVRDEAGAVANDLALRPDGRIVVAGTRPAGSDPNDTRAFAAQFLTSGDRDTAFGTGGATDVTTELSVAAGVAVDAAGRVVVGGLVCRGPMVVPSGSCGSRDPPSGSDVLVARLTAAGAPDGDFGTGGVTFTDLNAHESARGLDLAPDGKILVAGENSDTRGDRVLTARYEAAETVVPLDCGPLNTDPESSPGAPLNTPGAGSIPQPGDLDTTFNGTGVGISEFSSNFDDVVDAAVQTLPDGERVLVLDRDGRVWRFLRDGTLDLDFTGDGVLDVHESFAEPPYTLSPNAIAARSDGTFVVGGTVNGDEQGDPDGRFVGAASFQADGDFAWSQTIANEGFEITAVSDPANGTADLNDDGTITYTPDPGFVGLDSYTYEVTDPTGLTDSATVTARVGDDDALLGPAVTDDTVQTAQDTPTMVNVVANDVNDDNPNNLAITDTFPIDTPNGTATQPFLGWIEYTPDPGFTGLDSFTYSVADQIDGQTATGTMRVFVTGGGAVSGPVAADEAFKTFFSDADAPVTMQVLFNDIAAESTGFQAFGGVDVAAQSTGHLVLAGNGSVALGGERRSAIVLARLDPVGSPNALTSDAPFAAEAGFLSRFFGAGSITVQTNDQVVLSGAADSARLVVERWLAGLSGLDTTFSGDGLDVVAGVESSRAPVAIQANDGTIAVATEGDGSPQAWLLWRWDATGAFLGATSTAFDPDVEFTSLRSLVSAPDGSLLAAGTAFYPFDANRDADVLGAVRYTPDGESESPTADLLAAGGSDPEASAAVALADGFMIAGAVHDDVPDEEVHLRRALLIGLDSDGELDATFGFAGCLPHRAPADDGRAVGVTDDGRIVAGGVLDTGQDFGSDSAGIGIAAIEGAAGGFLLRHEEGGPLDGTFHPAGFPAAEVLPYEQDDGSFGFIQVQDIAVDPDGKVVVVGDDPNNGEGGTLAIVARLLPDGGNDPGFNDGQPFVSGFDQDLNGVALYPDGRIVAVGTRQRENDAGANVDEVFVLRLLPGGTPDPAFGAEGIAVVREFTSADGRDIAVQPDGLLVVTGSADGAVLVARLIESGKPDSSFGTGGVVLDDVTLDTDEGYSIAVRPDGGIVVGGQTRTGDNSIVLTQYRADGSRDPFFSTDGAVVTQGGIGEVGLVGMALDAIGNIVATGFAFPGNVGNLDILVTRVLPSGDFDPAFGDGGIVTTDLGGFDEGGDVAIAPDGDIVVTGTTADDRGERIVVARYEAGSELTCLPSPLDLGDRILTTGAAFDVITCTNTGPSRLEITSITESGSNATDFTADSTDCLVTLPSGASCEIPVEFEPTAVGGRSASLSVEHTAQGDGGPVIVGLRGTGVRPTRTLTFNPSPVNFGEQLPLATTPAQVVAVRNDGNLPLTITAVALDGVNAGEFAITSSTCTGVTLAPKGTCTVSVTFTGADVGARTGDLRFDGTADGAPVRLPIRGTVKTPTLIANPGVGTGGQVIEITGSNFPAGQPVIVAWADPLNELATTGFPEPSRTVAVAADGTFKLEMPTFRKTRVGTRAALATVGVFKANAPFLVALPTAQPAAFVIRS